MSVHFVFKIRSSSTSTVNACCQIALHFFRVLLYSAVNCYDYIAPVTNEWLLHVGGMILTWQPKCSAGEKICPSAIFVPELQHRVTRSWTLLSDINSILYGPCIILQYICNPIRYTAFYDWVYSWHFVAGHVSDLNSPFSGAFSSCML